MLLNAPDRTTRLALYDSLELPHDRHAIVLPFGPGPVNQDAVDRSQEMVLTYFYACDIQDAPLSPPQVDLLKRANEAVIQTRRLFFHGRADAKQDAEPPCFPSPTVLYETVHAHMPEALMSPYQRAGMCAYMGSGSQEDFAAATAALLKAEAKPGEHVELRYYPDPIGFAHRCMPVLVGADKTEVVCDAWAEGPAVLASHSSVAGLNSTGRQTVHTMQKNEFLQGFAAGREHEAALVQALPRDHRGERVAFAVPGLTMSAAFIDQTRRASNAYVNTSGTTRYTTGLAGKLTDIRHLVGRKDPQKLHQQMGAADASRKQAAQRLATEFGIPRDHVDETAKAMQRHAEALDALTTSARWSHANEAKGTVVQR